MMSRSLAMLAFVALMLPGGRALGAAAPAVVRVELYDWGIRVAPGRIGAGAVTFDVRNTATQTLHEMVVLKTDRPPEDLPYDAQKARVEEKRAGDVGEVEGLRPGGERRVTLNLAPGHYVLICNQPGHYKLGMMATLVVS